jgi:outer membrane lipoprotein SlyB
MKLIVYLIIAVFLFSFSGVSLCDEETVKKEGGKVLESAVTGAVLGGLLGGGVGAAIGSATGKAGTGAAIGAGVGAVGGSLIGASEGTGKESAAEDAAKPVEPSKDRTAKKRVIREYDEKGNVISEKEVKSE